MSRVSGARVLLETDGRGFELLLVEDTERGGRSVELWEIAPAPGRGLLLEAFGSAGGQFTFSALTREDIPLEALEWFVGRARATLTSD